MKGVVIFSAPSGSGKTTILKRVFDMFPDKFGFSVSATNRPPREGEIDGRDYYFLSTQEMKDKIAKGELLEWEEVYPGRFYGTPRSELERIWTEGRTVVFDVDVKGGMNIKKMLNKNAFSLFIMPPSIEELQRRLGTRGSETKESLKARIERAQMEISQSTAFDKVILNDDLETAVHQVAQAIEEKMQEWLLNQKTR